MRTVNIHAAKTHLSRLVEEAAAGEEIVIAKAGKPLARLCPLAEPKRKRVLGPLRRRDFGPRPDPVAAEARDIGFTELPVHSSVAATVADLPLIHRAPFDRL